MINPSTGETCVEGVPNNRYHNWGREINMNTVEQALAWRDGDSESYLVPVALT
jgi:viroplasmin and RNaseH domain-containing protein